MTSTSLITSQKRYWKSPLCGCCDYMTPTGDKQWFPFFIPMSVCGTCCVIGRLVTILEKENPIVCDMGPMGCLSCFLSNALFGPPGYMICGCFIRNRVMRTYNVDDPDGSQLLHGLCYPCSYFQMLMSVREWENEIKKGPNTTVTGTVQSPVYQPPK